MSEKYFITQILKMDCDMEGKVVYNEISVDNVWIQGLLVSKDGKFRGVIDDGTSSLEFVSEEADIDVSHFCIGDYLLVQGPVAIAEDTDQDLRITSVNAQRVSALSNPNLEIMWFLETVEYHQRKRK